MAGDISGTDLIEARLRAVTGYRPTPSEMDAIADLVETAERPFDLGAVTGEDPAAHFLPVRPAAGTGPA